MASIRRSEEEWIKIIQKCKSSGFSDIEWCKQNNVPVSTFYRQLNKLRIKASVKDCTKPVSRDEQEVIEINLPPEQLQSVQQPSTNSEVALRLNINGVTIDILNSAAKTTIENTLQSLRLLC